MDDIFDRLGEVTFAQSIFQHTQLFQRLNTIYGQACRSIFEDPELLERMYRYDAYVVDVVWPCGVFVKSYLEKHKNKKDIPIAILAPMVPVPFIFEQAGSPFLPSYQPVPTTALSSSMSFFERCKDTFVYLAFTFLINKETLRRFHNLVSDYDLDPDLQSRISEHVDLYFINSDFSGEFPFSLMPNVIPVGGVTSRPANPLDKDLEEFMQSSGRHGVVIFLLGTYFAEITTTHPEVVKMFVNAFSRIPQKVIMHLKKLPSEELPDNIKALPWLPLNDLMGHPKTRAVLYHGGNNGFYEALHHGVPLVVMPLAADQHDVATRVVRKGLGTKIDKNRLSTEHIYEQLNEVLSNPQYQATAKRLSAIFRDRPMKPADTAAFWIEHVIKHGGEHLRPPTLDMSFYQIYMLDIAIGGVTSRAANLLDDDLQEFMESSGEHGVVVFSLGSYYAEITTTHADVVDLFIEAFSRVPQKVIVHLKKLPSRKLPDNIKALPWLPLNDLMGHPKTRAALYHGGNNGYYEALYHGVPLVVMPLADDQHDVAVRVLSKGLGTKIDKNGLSTEHIYEQLNEVLSNPQYRATAKRLSTIFRDRPMKPADTAAFWIEHVIKHGGEHLRPPTLDMSFYQIYMLDIATAAIMSSFRHLRRSLKKPPVGGESSTTH
ncbi:UDP-glucuronosyltransferase 2B9-like [Diadema antillarum]|uniref:UDP-glucuronosyltransferase 2B9-like n=1 Tax=Diadema antillarum TaxID=105358 RepID=UPI003A87FC87